MLLFHAFGGLDQIFGRVAFLIPLDEQFGAHDAFLIDDVRSGIGDARDAAAIHFLIPDAIGIDGLAAFVREKRVLDAAISGELLQYIQRVVADRD